ncbi:MAG: DNA repair protein RadC [Candidatus Omnitrophota bacterium]|nr:DNA repair protein RadC [Candidatus Omnitrophota bacterium]
MPRIKDIPKVDRPREKFLKKGPDSLSKSELLAILLGSGIKGKNVKELAGQIIRKFGANFLDLTVNDLLEIKGIGQAKALQIISALELVKRFYLDSVPKENVIISAQNVISLSSDLVDKKKEYLVCFYLNARNVLLKKEIISIGILDKSLVHPREIFGLAVELRAAGVVLVHNHPSGNPAPSENDKEIVNRIIEAGKIMGINVIDFIIVAEQGEFSFFEKLNSQDSKLYVSDGIQYSLFDVFETTSPAYAQITQKSHKVYFSQRARETAGYFNIQNRRFLGNKYKLLGFIEDIVNEKCNGFNSFCDIFAGTGVVGERFNERNIKVISNDILTSNYVSLSTFLSAKQLNLKKLEESITYLNSVDTKSDNYFSEHYGNTYFTLENARKIGAIREKIDDITENEEEKNALITSLIYATDKVANTVGHYDAYRKILDSVQPLKLLIPKIVSENNSNNEVFHEDANTLIRKINCDVLYIDPPYNSRQYCDAYHLLENLARWTKPTVFGKAGKMDRSNLKSSYCLRSATKVFDDLIRNANCKHILISYNNTGESKNGRSNARISDNELIRILKNKGEVEIFERDYKAFTTGKSETNGHAERIFYCKVTN